MALNVSKRFCRSCAQELRGQGHAVQMQGEAVAQALRGVNADMQDPCSTAACVRSTVLQARLQVQKLQEELSGIAGTLAVLAGYAERARI